MLKPCNDHTLCCVCKRTFNYHEKRHLHDNNTFCDSCYNLYERPMDGNNKSTEIKEPTGFHSPEHYHKHEIDTITFLQKGFPPDVCMGFFKGSIIKYTQRADYKNGREDYLKILDFAKRMLEWYDKTHSE